MTQPDPATPHPPVPRYLQLMWGLQAPGRRGPKPGRTIHDIGWAAVALADRQGLSAVSMKAVAEALGLTTMSLYRYLDSKDELYAVMLDLAYGPPDRSLTARGTWRTRLERWARAIAAARLARPWTVLVPLTEPPSTPNTTAWTEVGLQAFVKTGLSAQEKMSSMLLLDGFVQQHIRLSLQLGFLSETGVPQEGDDGYPENLARLVDPSAFPNLVAAAQEALTGDDEDFFQTELDFGLGRILDGIAVLVAKSAS